MILHAHPHYSYVRFAHFASQSGLLLRTLQMQFTLSTFTFNTAGLDMKKLFSAVVLFAATQFSFAAEGLENGYKKISFVCEHGVAKSVIAAQYFNKLSKERGLKYRAVSRGISSESELQPATVAGLKKDGFDIAGIKPLDLALIDYETSEKVVLIGIEKFPDFLIPTKSINWAGVPSVGKDYDLARDDIVGRIEKLILSLQN